MSDLSPWSSQHREEQFDEVYMQTAILHSSLSRAKRLQVGACLVTKTGVTLTGFNGTPPGTSNNCEITDASGNLVTKASVIHAELNCILKAAREGVSVVDSTIYITHAPCLSCAAALLSAGVKKVYYRNAYRSIEGVEYLNNEGPYYGMCLQI